MISMGGTHNLITWFHQNLEQAMLVDGKAKRFRKLFLIYRNFVKYFIYRCEPDPEPQGTASIFLLEPGLFMIF
jgi:hypothetical protein